MSPSRRKPGLQEGHLSEQLGYRVAQAQVVLRRLYDAHVGEPLGLRPAEFSLLSLLQANDDVTPKQLAQALALSAPHLTLMLDRLQERGLLQRVRSESDRRSQHVRLTPLGLELAARAEHGLPHMDAELDRSLSKAERLMLMELLHKVALLGQA